MEDTRRLMGGGKGKKRLIFHIRKPVDNASDQKNKDVAIIACFSEICMFSYRKNQFETILSDILSHRRRRKNFKPILNQTISCDRHLRGSRSLTRLLRDLGLGVVEV